MKLLYSKGTLFCFIALASLLLSVPASFGQQIMSTTGYYQDAREKLAAQEYRYDSAAYYADQAARSFRKEGNEEAFAKATFNKAIYWSRMDRNDEAIALIKSTLASIDSASPYLLSHANRILGYIEMNRGNYSLAEEKIDLASQIDLSKDTLAYNELKALAHHTRGMIFFHQALFSQAKQEFSQAEEFYTQTIENQLQNKLYNLINLAATATSLGASYESIEILQSLLELIDRNYNEPQELTAMAYDGLAVNYKDLNLLEQSLEYHFKALDLYDNYFPYSPKVVSALNRLAFLYLGQKSFNDAMPLIQKAMEKANAIVNVKDKQLGKSYFNLGYYYHLKRDYKKSIEYYEKSKATYLQLAKPRGVSDVDFNLASVYIDLGKYDQARAHYSKGYQRSSQINGGLTAGHVEKSFILGTAYLNFRQYDSALYCYDKGIESSLKAYHQSYGGKMGSILNCVDDRYLIKILANKALLLKEFNENEGGGNMDKLKEALFISYQADSLFNRIRKAANVLKDSYSLLDLGAYVNHHIMSLSASLYDKTDEEIYLQKAFEYSEKNKSTLMLSRMQSYEGANELNIPDSILQLEQDLTQEIAYLESEILANQEDASSKNGFDMRAYQNELFRINQGLKSLNAHIEKTYPAYHHLKEVNSFVDIETIQNDFLAPDELLISFLWGNQRLYIFEIEKSKVNLRIVNINFSLNAAIYYYMEALEQSTSSVEDFLKANNKLVSILFPEPEAILKFKRIRIIPDREICQIPFESMVLRENVEDSIATFSNLNYLVKDHQISYGSSATTLFKQSSHKPNEEVNVIGFAPFFEEFSPTAVQNKDVVRDDAGPLLWSKPELDHIARHFNTRQLTGEQASENEMLQNAKNYEVIHMASHGFMNDAKPMTSKILLSSKNDSSTNDGVLNAREVYGLQLPAEMVVLSACFSGKGQVASGEGIISLANGFFYAGSKNVIMTLWQANDKSTADLMGHYYRHLADGKNKDESLRLAKLDYLSGADNIRSHPYFWAHFISNGNQAALVSKSLPVYIWFIVGPLLLIAVLIRLRMKSANYQST